MKITEVEIGYAETVSLPGYNNVRPSTRLVAQVGWDQAGQHEYDEDPDLVVADLQSMARQSVHDEVDRERSRTATAALRQSTLQEEAGGSGADRDRDGAPLLGWATLPGDGGAADEGGGSVPRRAGLG